MTETLTAIDPGNEESAFAYIDRETRMPIRVGKVPNDELADHLRQLGAGDRVAIEMIASYGMPVGAEVFETCVWIGRFEQIARDRLLNVQRIKRLPVKMHLCHDSKAKDSNVIQALVDRFAYGRPNRGKGTKGEPGWFYGFKDDIWQAYALAVYDADSDQFPPF